MARTPSGALVIEPAKDGSGFYWNVKWRVDGRQIKRRMGRAWVEARQTPADVDGWQRHYRKRRGEPRAGYLTPDEATAQIKRTIKAHAEREARQAERRERVTFEQAARDWFEQKGAERGWKGTTRRNYAALLAHEEDTPKLRGRKPRGRIMATFGHIDVREVTMKDVRAFLRTLDADPDLSARSVNAHLGVLAQVCKFAIEEGWRDDDPTAGAAKRREADPGELIVFTPEQVQAIAGASADPMHAALIVTAAFSGLRMGELLELRWRDVSFDKESIHVQRAYSQGLGVSSPKGRRGRSVPMSQQVAQALATLGQRDYRTGARDLVFCREDGEHLDPTSTRQRFYSARDKAAESDPDLPLLRFHDLRHTFGSLAAASGMDLVWIKNVMGHADLKTTMRYLHSRPHASDAAKLSAAFATEAIEQVPAAV